MALLERLSSARAQLPLLALLCFLYAASLMGLPLTGGALRLGLANYAFMQLVYLADRYFAPAEDAANGVRPPEPLPVPGSVFFFALAAAAAYIASFPRQWVFPAAGLLLFFLYSFPPLGRLRLKNFFLSKTLINASLFTAAVTFSPALLRWGAEPPVLAAVARAAAGMFPAALCLTVLLDVRDAAGDAAAGVRTLPVVLGARRASLGVAVLAAAAGLLAWHGGSRFGTAFYAVLAGASLFAAGRGRLYFEGCLLALNLLAACALFGGWR